MRFASRRAASLATRRRSFVAHCRWPGPCCLLSVARRLRCCNLGALSASAVTLMLELTMRSSIGATAVAILVRPLVYAGWIRRSGWCGWTGGRRRGQTRNGRRRGRCGSSRSCGRSRSCRRCRHLWRNCRSRQLGSSRLSSDVTRRYAEQDDRGGKRQHIGARRRRASLQHERSPLSIRKA